MNWTADGDAAAWHDAGNWDLFRVPTSRDNVCIADGVTGAGGTTTKVTYSAAAGSTTVNSLEDFDEDSEISGGALSIDAAFQLHDGTWSVPYGFAATFGVRSCAQFRDHVKEFPHELGGGGRGENGSDDFFGRGPSNWKSA